MIGRDQTHVLPDVTAGEQALADYLLGALCTVLAVWLVEQGPAKSRELIAQGLFTAAAFDDENEPAISTATSQSSAAVTTR